MKRILCALLALAMLFCLAACGDEAPQTMTLRIDVPDAPETLDPAYITTDTEATLTAHLYENLLRPTESGAVSGMAKSYTVTDNLDGTETYTFTLRSDAKWSDGTRVSARDFVYAWRRLVDPAAESPNAALLNMVSGYSDAILGDVEALGVSAEDETTFSVALNGHCPYFISSICTIPQTMPVKAAAVGKKPVTNGAYAVAEQTSDAMTLALRKDYYDAKRIFAEQLAFSFRVARDDAMTRFADGETDIVLDSAAAEEALLSYNTEMTVLLVNQMTSNLRREPLRQALSLSLDRSALCEELGEAYIPAEGLVPCGIAAVSSDSFRSLGGAVIDNTPENYEANCGKAKELMGSTAPSGVTLLYESALYQKTAQSIQQMWKEQLGILITLRPVSREEMEEALTLSEFSMALTTVDTDRNDAAGYLRRFGSSSQVNYGLFFSAPYDMLMNVANRASDARARDAYMEDAERLLLESGYVIPLFSTTHHWLVRSDLAGVFDAGQGTHLFNAVRKIPTK